MDQDEAYVISGPLIAVIAPFVAINGGSAIRGAIVTIGAECAEHGFEPVLSEMVSMS